MVSFQTGRRTSLAFKLEEEQTLLSKLQDDTRLALKVEEEQA